MTALEHHSSNLLEVHEGAVAVGEEQAFRSGAAAAAATLVVALVLAAGEGDGGGVASRGFGQVSSRVGLVALGSCTDSFALARQQPRHRAVR
eukprot:scaffold349_cov352-Prasinococcus_capsulatus_cf.AAC.6